MVRSCESYLVFYSNICDVLLDEDFILLFLVNKDDIIGFNLDNINIYE